MNKGILIGVALAFASQGGLAEGAKKKGTAAKGSETVVAANQKVKHAIPAENREVADARGDSDVDYTEPRNLSPEVSSRPADASPEGQNVTSTKAAEVGKSKWSGSIESRNEFVAQTVNTGDKSAGVINDLAFWLRLNYSVSDNFRLGVGQDIDHNLFASNPPAEQRTLDFYDNDPFVRAMIPTVAHLPADINLSLEGRAYAPISGQSLASQQTKLRLYGVLSKDLGKVSLSYMLQPRFYVSTGPNTTYQYQNPDGSYLTLATTSYRVINMVEATYKFNDIWSVYQDVGTDDIVANSTPVSKGVAAPGEVSYEILETAVNYTPDPRYRVTAGVTSYEHNYRVYGLTTYGPETRYFVSGYASFQ